jgi:hypothetical protein
MEIAIMGARQPIGRGRPGRGSAAQDGQEGRPGTCGKYDAGTPGRDRQERGGEKLGEGGTALDLNRLL